MTDGFDEHTGLPTTNRDQSCAFCGRVRPQFAHGQDPAHVRFRIYGKEWTLPTFWTVCESCEPLVTGGNDEALLRRLLRRDADEPMQRAALTAFRAADRGATGLKNV